MVSDIQDYIKYIIKKHKTLIAIPPILAYINRVNNISVFEINDGYKPELKMSKTMKLSGSTKRKKIGKKGEGVPTLEVFEVFLVQCNLIDNKYQQKSQLLYSFTPNKPYAYLNQVI